MSATRRLWSIALSALFVGLIFVAAGMLAGRDKEDSSTADLLLSLEPGFGAADFDAALQAADERVALNKERVDRDPSSWLNQQGYAGALMARYRLSGSYQDLALADDALARGMAESPAHSGPALTNAIFNFTVHRLDRMVPSLATFEAAAVPHDRGDRSEAMALAGDLDFYRGRYGAALEDYRAAQAEFDYPGIAFRLGQWYKKMNRPELALGEFARAARQAQSPSPQLLSSVLLQAGTIELERGNWERAETYFDRADRLFPGYWLNEAHLAQMRALDGDYAGARRGYEAILARVPRAEVMDALAALLRLQGEGEASRRWSARAGKAWERQIALFPEAAYGHAVDHELALGDPRRALDYARRNFAARPYGDSAVLLAWTMLANNRAGEAATLLEKVNATGWDGAQQHRALSEAYARLGRRTDSEAERERALALNPRIFDSASPLIWFGHH